MESKVSAFQTTNLEAQVSFSMSRCAAMVKATSESSTRWTELMVKENPQRAKQGAKQGAMKLGKLSTFGMSCATESGFLLDGSRAVAMRNIPELRMGRAERFPPELHNLSAAQQKRARSTFFADVFLLRLRLYPGPLQNLSEAALFHWICRPRSIITVFGPLWRHLYRRVYHRPHFRPLTPSLRQPSPIAML